MGYVTYWDAQAENSERQTRLEGDLYTIGRHGDIKAHWMMACVSRLHCGLFRIGSTFRIRDLNSHCGTKVNGVDIGNKDILLKHGDIITVGRQGELSVTYWGG